MTDTACDAMPCGDSHAALAYACDRQRAANRAAADQLAAVVEYCRLNAPDPTADDARGWPATWMEQHGGDTGESLAGEGAPDVSEFAVLHLAAALGMSPYAGRAYVGDALEIAYRLPRLWAAVQAGTLPVWRARLVAKQTMMLPAAAALEVDTRVAPVAHKVGTKVLGRLVAEALARHDPAEAERRRVAAAESRHVRIHLDGSLDGTADLHGNLDLADAHALEEALRLLAQQLAENGSTDTLQVRRATALGLLARRQLDPDQTDHTHTPRGRRELVLHIHASATDVADVADVADEESGASLARVDEVPGLDGFIGLTQVKGWCADPDTQITIKPVIDLNTIDRVDAYQIPDAIHEQVKLRDGTCRFPWCPRPARRCQTDHTEAYGTGGHTATDNLASLCPAHHRLKTHGGWTYRTVAPATYLWRAPDGRQFLVDPTGTLDLNTPP